MLFENHAAGADCAQLCGCTTLAGQNQEEREMHHRWPYYEFRNFGYHAAVFCQDDLGDRHAVHAEVFDHEGCDSHAA